jgi:hypothetical protein
MADEPEEVLELDPEDEIHEDENKTQGSAEETEDGEEETVIGFEGEEESPASEGNSSVIRELRQRIGAQNRELAELRRANPKPKIEVGEEPSLEGCDYDEDRFKDEWRQWNDRKAAAARQEAENQQAAERQQTEWQSTAQAYEASKGKLNVPNFDDAESEVFAALPAETKALLLRSGKAAELVVALSRSPANLEQLSKLNLADAAMMIGELRGKVKVMTTRRTPEPDRPVRGNAAPANADKELARLEKEADRTGDRSALIAYRKKLRDRA